MMMHKFISTRDDRDGLYPPRKDGGRELVTILDNIDTTTGRLHKKEVKKN